MSNGLIKAGPQVMMVREENDTDLQVSTAKAYPRSMHAFKDEVTSMLQLNQELAGECSYALPRGGKIQTGPSIRFAEILACAWGNMVEEKRALPPEQDMIRGQATVWDIQRNRKVRVECMRRITGKGGKRYSEDMIAVTGNAAASIAHRNAILAVIPKVFWQPMYQHALSVSAGREGDLNENRGKALTYWKSQGVSEERVLRTLKRPSVEDMTVGDIATLKAVYSSINEGSLTIATAFPEDRAIEPGEKKTRNQQVLDALKEPQEDNDVAITFDPKTGEVKE